jgi:hypothetical protein
MIRVLFLLAVYSSRVRSTETCDYLLRTSETVSGHDQFLSYNYCTQKEDIFRIPYTLCETQNAVDSNGDPAPPVWLNTPDCGQDVGPYPTLRYVSAQDQLCGIYSSRWGRVNSSVVIGKFGPEATWVFASANVIKDCILLTGEFNSDMTSTTPTVLESAAALNVFEQCWQGCTYRTMGQFSTAHVPESFELVVTPFYGAMPTIAIARFKASEGYAELSPTIMSMGMINWVKVKTELATVSATVQATLLNLAMSTVMFTGLLSAPVGTDAFPFLKEFLFPASLPDPVDFWEKMAGSESGTTRLPVFACGDTHVAKELVMGMYSNYPSSKVEGTVDGEAVPGGGCGPPFIQSYMEGKNSTLLGDEVLGAGLSLSLMDEQSKQEFSFPPLVGPVEDYVNSVCPHAHDDFNFVDIVQAISGKELTEVEICTTSGMFDVTSSRLKLPTAEVYQFDSNVLYMPAAMEVYAWKKFVPMKDGFSPGDPVTNSMKWLLMLKLRYVDSAAGGAARKRLDILNTQNGLSAECDAGDLSAFSLSKRSSWTGTIESSVPAGSVREGMCYYAAIINAITQLCQVALNKDIINGLRESCDMAYKAVMAKVSNLCTGDCDRSMLQGFICTSVNAAVGSDSCTSMDVMASFLENQCSSYYSFMGAYCSSVSMYTGSGFGYSPMSGMYYASYAFNPMSAYYGSGMTNLGTGGMGYSYSYYYRKSRRLSATHCGDMGHADSLECMSYITISTSSGSYFATSSSVGTAEDVLQAYDDDIYFSHAMAKLSDAFWHLSPAGDVPVSLVTLSLGELIRNPIQSPSEENPNTTKGSYEILVSAGTFLAKIGSSHSGQANVVAPIFPICDAEFEESVVRDAVQVSSISDACTPYVGGKTMRAVMRNIDMAEKMFNKMPVSNIIGAIFSKLT